MTILKQLIFHAADLGILSSNTAVENLIAWDAAMAALDPISKQAGARWIFEPGIYHFAGQLSVKRQMIIEGVAGIDAGTGTIFSFPTNSNGLFIKGYDDDTGDGRNTILRHLRLTGGGGTSGDGITIRMVCHCEHLYIEGFGRDGVHIAADVHGITEEEGTIGLSNANGWSVFNLVITACGRHGLLTQGDDTNAGLALRVTSVNNEGWGFYEDSAKGNTYIACQVDANKAGGYWANNKNATSTFLGCYAEGGSTIDTGAALWFGGVVAGESQFVGGGAVLYRSGVFRRGLDFRFTEGGSGGHISVGGGASNLTGTRVVPTADGGDIYFDAYNGGSSWDKAFGIYSRGHPANPSIILTTAKTHNGALGALMEPGEVVFPSGIFLGGWRINYGDYYKDLRTSLDSLNFKEGQTVHLGDTLFNRVAYAGEHYGFRCILDGTVGRYAEGLTVSAPGDSRVVMLSGPSKVLRKGQWLTIGGSSRNLVESIIGATLTMSYVVTAGDGQEINYSPPQFEGLGRLTGGIVDDALSPGHRTQNATKGRSAFPAGSNSITISNSHVTATSLVFCQLQTKDSTLTHIVSATPTAGSFTVVGNANSTGITVFCWHIAE